MSDSSIGLFMKSCAKSKSLDSITVLRGHPVLEKRTFSMSLKIFFLYSY